MLTEFEKTYLQHYLEKNVKTCPICQGQNPSCVCWKNYKLEIAKISANIPVKFRSFKLKQLTHPQLQKQKEIIKQYIIDLQENRFNGKSLYIYGTKGTAKTMCASIVIMNALKRGFRAYYFSSMKAIAEMLKQDWGNDSNTLETILTEYDYIAIDNIGIDTITNPNIIEAIKSIFTTRANNLLPIIFVSPSSVSKIGSPLDASVVEVFKPVLQDLYFNGFDYQEEIINKRNKAGVK